MIKIEISDLPHPHYFEMIEHIYGKSSVTQSFILATKEGLNAIQADSNITIKFFHLFESEQLIGHLALMFSKQQEGYFGFFEITKLHHFDFLWQSMVNCAKEWGITKIFGPVNGTVWHPYRVISETSNEPFFLHEPLSSINYFDLLTSKNPQYKLDYHSAFRSDYEIILDQTKKSYATLLGQNITIVNKELNSDLLKTIYSLSVSIFSNNPGYYPLQYEDFVKLYSHSDNDQSKPIVFIVFHDLEPIGFSYNLLIGNTLIMKTIGVKNEWQEKGVGNALVHEIHQFAQQKSISKVIYALIRADNKIQHFPKDDVQIFRKYSAFLYSM